MSRSHSPLGCVSAPRPTSPLPMAAHPQRLLERGPHDTIVQHSPYGASRNAAYGWGTLFQPPVSTVVPGYPNIHIGISSLNGVPTVGKSDRSMRSLLAQYRKKFNCLEHCYPFHKVGDAQSWRGWAEMVRDSNTARCDDGERGPAASDGVDIPEAVSAFPLTKSSAFVRAVSSASELSSSADISPLNPTRFVFTIKANNFLTHVKQLHMEDTEVVAQGKCFFHERCPLLHPFLGPILLQLPPSFGYSATNVQRLVGLHELVLKQNAVVAEGSTLVGRTSSHPQLQQQGLRIAVEFRNPSWYREETLALLRSFRWALVVAQHHDDATFSQVMDTGAGFIYVRLHGPLGRNVGDYGPLAMQLWAEEILRYLQPRMCGGDGGSIDDEQAPLYSTLDEVHQRPLHTQRVPPACEREVFFFLNNSDSHVSGTTSSVVDATALAQHLRRLLHAAKAGAAPSDKLCSTPALSSDASPSTYQAEGTVIVTQGAEGSSGGEVPPPQGDDDGDAPPLKRPRGLSTQ